MTAVVAPKSWLSNFVGHLKNNNNSNTTTPQTHIAFIVPRLKGIGSHNKSGTWKNQGRQRTNTCDKWCFNSKDSHSKSNKL